MSKKVTQVSKVITPVDVVQESNPLIKGITKVSEKWNKRWPDIDQPWPVEGTLNLDVIKTMQVLVSTYKADQKKGKTGEKRKEKRQIEMGILQLFEHEGQKRMKAAQEKKKGGEVEIGKNTRETDKLMAEVNTPFSHVDSVKKPPPYEKEVRFEDMYPQLPVISQEGNYHIRDMDDHIIETGRAETTIRMYPSVKSKRKQRHFETKGELRIRRMESGDEGDQSDCEIKGGYDPAVRRILARAEKRGDKTWRKEEPGDDSSNESENGDSDGDSESEGFSSRAFFPATSSTRMEEDRQRAVREVERSIEQCLSHLDKSTGFESRKALENQLEGLQMQKKKLQKEGSKKFDMKYVLRSRKGKRPEKMCPVVVRGQSLEYKPWQNTDMSDILEKLPTLQDGAYPWISKLEEIMVGTQPAIGDIKRLLANLLGVPAMEEIL